MRTCFSRLNFIRCLRPLCTIKKKSLDTTWCDAAGRNQRRHCCNITTTFNMTLEMSTVRGDQAAATNLQHHSCISNIKADVFPDETPQRFHQLMTADKQKLLSESNTANTKSRHHLLLPRWRLVITTVHVLDTFRRTDTDVCGSLISKENT